MRKSRSRNMRTQKNRKQNKRTHCRSNKKYVGRKYKNKSRRTKTKRGYKSRMSQRRNMIQQHGGFVKPFVPEFLNLMQSVPYKMSENYHTINPPAYPAPGNPDKVDINPHPAYDQYLRGNSKMVDPESVLGPNLKQQFDQSIKVNNSM